jgi:hypothetical protein
VVLETPSTKVFAQWIAKLLFPQRVSHSGCPQSVFPEGCSPKASPPMGSSILVNKGGAPRVVPQGRSLKGEDASGSLEGLNFLGTPSWTTPIGPTG